MDIVDVSDVESSVARFGDRYLERVYTARELAACADGADTRRLAAHFAAKEATLKTLLATDRGVDWRSIELRLRSEEHTSELQSLTNLVCRLLLEKKKTGELTALRHDARTGPRDDRHRTERVPHQHDATILEPSRPTCHDDSPGGVRAFNHSRHAA